MFVIGVALWFGSNLESGLWKWDLIGLLAHLPPLAVNFIFADLFSSYHFRSTSMFSIALHTIFISLELFAIFIRVNLSELRTLKERLHDYLTDRCSSLRTYFAECMELLKALLLWYSVVI